MILTTVGHIRITQCHSIQHPSPTQLSKVYCARSHGTHQDKPWVASWIMRLRFCVHTHCEDPMHNYRHLCLCCIPAHPYLLVTVVRTRCTHNTHIYVYIHIYMGHSPFLGMVCFCDSMNMVFSPKHRNSGGKGYLANIHSRQNTPKTHVFVWFQRNGYESCPWTESRYTSSFNRIQGGIR